MQQPDGWCTWRWRAPEARPAPRQRCTDLDAMLLPTTCPAPRQRLQPQRLACSQQAAYASGTPSHCIRCDACCRASQPSTRCSPETRREQRAHVRGGPVRTRTVHGTDGRTEPKVHRLALRRRCLTVHVACARTPCLRLESDKTAAPAQGVLPISGSPFTPFVWAGDAAGCPVPFAILGDASQARRARPTLALGPDVTRAPLARSCCKSRSRLARR